MNPQDVIDCVHDITLMEILPMNDTLIWIVTYTKGHADPEFGTVCWAYTADEAMEIVAMLNQKSASLGMWQAKRFDEEPRLRSRPSGWALMIEWIDFYAACSRDFMAHVTSLGLAGLVSYDDVEGRWVNGPRFTASPLARHASATPITAEGVDLASVSKVLNK